MDRGEPWEAPPDLPALEHRPLFAFPLQRDPRLQGRMLREACLALESGSMLAGVAGAGGLLVWEERGKPRRSLRLGWRETGLQPRRTAGQDSGGFAKKSSVRAAEA